MRVFYPTFSSPPIRQLLQPETVSVASWSQQAVVRRRAPTSMSLFSGAFRNLPSTPASTVFVSSANPDPIAVDVVQLPVGSPGPLATTATPETLTLDKWTPSNLYRLAIPRPIMNPTARVLSFIDEQIRAVFIAGANPDPISVDTVQLPSGPSRPITVPATPETITLDKWLFAPLYRVAPTRSIINPTSRVLSFTSEQANAVFIGGAAPDPIAPQIRLLPLGVNPLLVITGPPETITMDKWFMPPVVPAPRVKRLPNYGVNPMIAAEADDGFPDYWFQPIQQPRIKVRGIINPPESRLLPLPNPPAPQTYIAGQPVEPISINSVLIPTGGSVVRVLPNAVETITLDKWLSNAPARHNRKPVLYWLGAGERPVQVSAPVIVAPYLPIADIPLTVRRISRKFRPGDNPWVFLITPGGTVLVDTARSAFRFVFSGLFGRVN